MQNFTYWKLPFHYGWVIAATGTCSIFACLGFGRFALGMLLPSMASTLNLNYSEMGYISTGNFIGYLVAVFMSGAVVARLGQRAFIFISLLIVGSTMVFLNMAGSFASLLVLYFVTGMGSGGANVSTMSLASPWFNRTKRGRAAGFMSIGSGFAIVFAGFFIPYVNGVKGAEGWRTSWFCLGLMVLVIAVMSVVLVRNKPADVGLEPVGEGSGSAQQAASSRGPLNVYRSKPLYHLGAIYFLFGYTYVIYATFIVTTLVKERGLSEAVAGNFWSWVGFLSLFSGPVFGSISDRLGRKTGMIIVFSFQFIAYLLVATGLPGMFLYLSILFYGLVAWSIPTIMAAAVAEYVGVENAAKAFGFITLIFGLGQITGPALAGVLAERSGSFSGSFYMAAAFAAAAIVLCMFLKKPR